MVLALKGKHTVISLTDCSFDHIQMCYLYTFTELRDLRQRTRGEQCTLFIWSDFLLYQRHECLSVQHQRRRGCGKAIPATVRGEQY